MTSLRARNRLNAMRTVQRLALPMFLDRGFDDVGVDEIAGAAGMAASTVYRHFGTKEEIVLWDEHDVEIDQALERRLRRQPPLEAIRDAFVDTLGGRYNEDLEFQLVRIRYIYATEQLHAAAVEADFRVRHELTEALQHVLSRQHRHAAPIIAGASLLALDVAMERWQASEAVEPLADLLTQSFESLVHLADLR